LRVQIKLWKFVAAAGLMALGGELAVGCGGPRGANICDDRCDCEGCSVASYDDCYFEADDDAAFADRRGCYNLYDAFIACQEITGFCERGRDYRTDCAIERDKWRRCVE
jgi:hypothetical protein